MKYVVIVLMVVFAWLDLFLLWKYSTQKSALNDLKKENSALTISNANYKDQSHYREYILSKNMGASYHPIVYNKRVASWLEKQPEESYLLIRFDVQTCSTCFKEFMIFVENVIKKVGKENILLFQIGESSDPYVEAALPKHCKIFQIEKEEFYATGVPDSETPYLFVYKKGERYPFLFSFYPADIVTMDILYIQSFVKYFDQTSPSDPPTKLTGVEQCDTSLYIRNAVETWELYTAERDLSKGDTLLLPNGITATIRSNIPKGATIRYPSYKESEGNCCEKGHLKRAYRYP